MTALTILVFFLVAVAVGIVGWIISAVIPFLKQYANGIGLGLFAITLLIELLTKLN